MLALHIIQDVPSQQLCVGLHTSTRTVAGLHLQSDHNGCGTVGIACSLHCQGTVNMCLTRFGGEGS